MRKNTSCVFHLHPKRKKIINLGIICKHPSSINIFKPENTAIWYFKHKKLQEHSDVFKIATFGNVCLENPRELPSAFISVGGGGGSGKETFRGIKNTHKKTTNTQKKSNRFQSVLPWEESTRNTKTVNSGKKKMEITKLKTPTNPQSISRSSQPTKRCQN